MAIVSMGLSACTREESDSEWGSHCASQRVRALVMLILRVSRSWIAALPSAAPCLLSPAWLPATTHRSTAVLRAAHDDQESTSMHIWRSECEVGACVYMCGCCAVVRDVRAACRALCRRDRCCVAPSTRPCVARRVSISTVAVVCRLRLCRACVLVAPRCAVQCNGRAQWAQARDDTRGTQAHGGRAAGRWGLHERERMQQQQQQRAHHRGQERGHSGAEKTRGG